MAFELIQKKMGCHMFIMKISNYDKLQPGNRLGPGFTNQWCDPVNAEKPASALVEKYKPLNN
jgi:hypothetical protein